MDVLENMVILYFDGLCEPKNPSGVATYGYVVYKGCNKIHEGYGLVGAGMFGDDVSNNVAEYTAMIRGLEYLISFGYNIDVIVRGDSQLTIKQMQGKYAVRAKRLIKLHEKANALRKTIQKIAFEWVPRENNEEADLLSRRAFEEFLASHRMDYEKYYKMNL